MLLELKKDEITRWTPERYEYLAAIVARYQTQPRTRLLSFSAEILQRAKTVDPSFFTTWIAPDGPTRSRCCSAQTGTDQGAEGAGSAQ